MFRISTFHDHPFQCHCVNLLWLVLTNREEAIWLATWLLPTLLLFRRSLLARWSSLI